MKIKKDEGSCQKLASAGTKSRVAARELKHQRYLDVLIGANEYHIEQTTIQSREALAKRRELLGRLSVIAKSMETYIVYSHHHILVPFYW